jgi:5,10-methylenetetrahydromethanopterin reductase
VFPIGLKPATIKKMEESVTTIRALCSGDEAPGGEKGPYKMVTGKGPIPIYIAANQQRMLRLSGRVADGVILMGGANEDFTKWQIDRVREGAEQAGRSMDDIKLHLWANISLSEDREQARDDVSHWVASQAETFSKWKELPAFLEPYKSDFESASKSYDRLEHMSQHAQHKRVVSGELIDYLALVGTADECLERIRSLEPLGLDGVTLAFRAGGRKETMDELHEGIIKPLKGL